MQFKNLFSGNLDRLILKKLKDPYNSGEWVLNYELESQEETKLRDLYNTQQ
jgi:hypothetical protein